VADCCEYGNELLHPVSWLLSLATILKPLLDVAGPYIRYVVMCIYFQNCAQFLL